MMPSSRLGFPIPHPLPDHFQAMIPPVSVQDLSTDDLKTLKEKENKQWENGHII